MRIVVLGTGPFAVPMFQSLLDSPHDVAALITRPTSPAKGREKEPTNPMRELAESRGLAVHAPATINSEEGRQTISIETIQKKVAEHFDLRLADMTGTRRPENIAFPRQIAMFLARQLTQLSLNAIGEGFGGRDHGTVLHACRTVKGRMEVDGQIRQVVNRLELQLIR